MLTFTYGSKYICYVTLFRELKPTLRFPWIGSIFWPQAASLASRSVCSMRFRSRL